MWIWHEFCKGFIECFLMKAYLGLIRSGVDCADTTEMQNVENVTCCLRETSIIRDVVIGLSKIHCAWIAHSDIKGQNWLFFGNATKRMRILVLVISTQGKKMKKKKKRANWEVCCIKQKNKQTNSIDKNAIYCLLYTVI